MTKTIECERCGELLEGVYHHTKYCSDCRAIKGRQYAKKSYYITQSEGYKRPKMKAKKETPRDTSCDGSGYY